MIRHYVGNIVVFETAFLFHMQNKVFISLVNGIIMLEQEYAVVRRMSIANKKYGI